MEKLSQTEFDENVIEEEQHCIVLFSRKDCHVCQAVHPMLEDLESDYGSIPFYQVDVEEEPALFQKYGGKGVPQVISFQGGESDWPVRMMKTTISNRSKTFCK